MPRFLPAAFALTLVLGLASFSAFAEPVAQTGGNDSRQFETTPSGTPTTACPAGTPTATTTGTTTSTATPTATSTATATAIGTQSSDDHDIEGGQRMENNGHRQDGPHNDEGLASGQTDRGDLDHCQEPAHDQNSNDAPGQVIDQQDQRNDDYAPVGSVTATPTATA